METFVCDDEHYTLVADQSGQQITLLKNSDTADGEFSLASRFELPQAVTLFKPFSLFGQIFFAGYQPGEAYLNLYQLNDALSAVSKVRSQYVGSGYTMVQPLSYRYDNFIVLYNQASGDVAKYQMQIPAYHGVGMQQTWSDIWAKTWNRFAFFSFGGENFFIKTNLSHEKVNIDHFMDGLDQGSHPVLSEQADNDMLNAQTVVTFQDAKGEAFFAVCSDAGKVIVNRIFPNCEGWDTLCSSDSGAGIRSAVPVVINHKTCLLLAD
ncbi:MAG: hypothetical protein CMI02_19055 [Oceanospirillaceae bacterium]|nr:hypothetical protein [Oceanospirillaceae bacterium]MBT14127.1 hypothetical protein [Oceanospirillaceae bacterium]|tara:strand:+ start:34802 stop:35596 length:795 start_codon:yes stop_codon:yes gene_type:complete